MFVALHRKLLLECMTKYSFLKNTILLQLKELAVEEGVVLLHNFCTCRPKLKEF